MSNLLVAQVHVDIFEQMQFYLFSIIIWYLFLNSLKIKSSLDAL